MPGDLANKLALAEEEPLSTYRSDRAADSHVVEIGEDMFEDLGYVQG
jgi:hypothetical protein